MRSHTVLMLAVAIVVGALGCREDAESPTAPEAGLALKTTRGQVLSFRQLSAGGVHTCGVTLDHRAYCWGLNGGGQLGNGTTAPQLTPVAVTDGLRFRELGAGGVHT